MHGTENSEGLWPENQRGLWVGGVSLLMGCNMERGRGSQQRAKQVRASETVIGVTAAKGNAA